MILLAAVAITSASALQKSSTDAPGSRFDGPAELPRVFVHSSLADTPARGKRWEVKSSDDLQAILKRANCGDTIQLQAGATFTGVFTLPAKVCDDDNWILIRSNAPDAALPPEGTRITPCYAGVASLPGRPPLNCTSTQKAMATLAAIKSGGPLLLASGANHYRLGPGLEITRTAGTGINYNLIAPQGNAPADHIIVDRDWVHGTAQDETTRGLYLSGVTSAAVVDSYFNDFHCVAAIGACTDSQAIAGGLGNLPQGTWKIENNFLEAAAENILFGGGTGTTTPTDIEIRRNHIFKPLIWMPGQPGFVGGANNDPTKCAKSNTPGQCPFVVKNLFELKNAQRLLFEGNVLEYTWPGFTQHGAAVLLTALSQGGKAGNPNATVADITIRYNQISHAASGVVIAEAAYEQGPPKLEARISIHDDLFDDLSPAYYYGDTSVVAGMAFQLSFCPNCTPIRDVLIDHVTMLLTSPRMFMVLGAPLGSPIQNLTFTNNIVSSPPGLAITGTGAKAPCGFQGNAARERLKSCVAPLRFEGNALVGTNDNWPRGNFFPQDLKSVKFLSYDAGSDRDYRLSPQSPHKNRGTDGKDLGADIDAITRLTSNVRGFVPATPPLK
jgi:hypothetical protein